MVEGSGRAVAVLALLVFTVLVGTPPVTASAEPTVLCTMTDPRLDEVSGLVATGNGFVVMNDGRYGTSVLELYQLNTACEVVGVITDPGFDPIDPEDLAMTPDGALWVADIGDNDRQRATVALDRLAPGTRRGTRYRLAYPDGPHDAEALLMPADGLVVLVTKEISGVSAVYTSVTPLTGVAGTVTLRRVGTLSGTAVGSDGRPSPGSVASGLVTGGAVSPDDRRIVLRTYTDAYEWDVPDGDIARALITGTPRVTALPGEDQGESISYTPRGDVFVTTSEGVPAAVTRRVPAVRPATPSTEATPVGGGADQNRLGGLLPGEAAAALAVVIGVVLLGTGLIGLALARRRHRRETGVSGGRTQP